MTDLLRAESDILESEYFRPIVPDHSCSLFPLIPTPGGSYGDH